MSLTPAKFYLPGIFLLALGIGNVIVGENRALQYEIVLTDLATLQHPPVDTKRPVLNRIQSLQKHTDRRGERLNRARAKRDFYRLVGYGGKVLSGTGVLLLGIALLLALRVERSNRAPSIQSA